MQVVQISAGFCILRLEVLTHFLQWKSEVIKKHPLVLVMICEVSRWLWLQQKVWQDYTESWGNLFPFSQKKKKQEKYLRSRLKQTASPRRSLGRKDKGLSPVGMRWSVLLAGLAGSSLCFQLLLGLLFILLKTRKGGESWGSVALQSLPGGGQTGQCKFGSEIALEGRCEWERGKA